MGGCTGEQNEGIRFNREQKETKFVTIPVKVCICSQGGGAVVAIDR